MDKNGHNIVCSCKACRESKCDGNDIACVFSICTKCLIDDSTKSGATKLNEKCSCTMKLELREDNINEQIVKILNDYNLSLAESLGLLEAIKFDLLKDSVE